LRFGASSAPEFRGGRDEFLEIAVDRRRVRAIADDDPGAVAAAAWQTRFLQRDAAYMKKNGYPHHGPAAMCPATSTTK
jgi:hypothetical protein